MLRVGVWRLVRHGHGPWRVPTLENQADCDNSLVHWGRRAWGCRLPWKFRIVELAECMVAEVMEGFQ